MQETADTKKLDVIEYDDDDSADVKPFNAGSPASYKENISDYKNKLANRKKDKSEVKEKVDPLQSVYQGVVFFAILFFFIWVEQ